MRFSLNLFIILSLLAFLSCEKEENNSELSNSLVGFYENPQYSDSLITYEKTSALSENSYGLSIKPDGELLERKNAGWCGTPPITYADFDGAWTQKDSVLYISVEYWGGIALYQWKIISLDDSTLKIQILEEAYDYNRDK